MSKRIEILQLHHEPGGPVEAVGAEYSRSLDKTRYGITFAYLFGRPGSKTPGSVHADEVHYFDLTRRQAGGIPLAAAKRLAEFSRRKRFDVIVCHRYKAARIAALARLFHRIPHSFYVVHGLGYMKDVRRRLIARATMRKSFKFIAVSDAVRRDILQSRLGLSQDSVLTIHNTIDVDALRESQLKREAARARLGLAASDFLFGSVGRLVDFKHHDHLIEAFALVSSKLNSASLAIVGEGRLRDRLVALARTLGVESRIRFTGAVPSAANLMHAFDVFVLPSIEEPFGLVLLEAWAAERPIIAYASGGVPEIVSDIAITPDALVPAALARRLVEVYRLTNDERRKLGVRGLAHLRQHFGRSRFGDLMDGLFATIS